MIENRRRKFIGNLLNDEIFTVVLNMCFKCALSVLVFFFVFPLKLTTAQSGRGKFMLHGAIAR